MSRAERNSPVNRNFKMTRNIALRIGSFSIVLLLIYLTSLYNYLLFHSIAEVFSIIIAFGIFFFAWNSREFLKNHYFLFLGVAYLFIGIIDLVHTLSYKGMGIFIGFDSNLPTQLWIAVRYLESISLLLSFQFFKRKYKPHSLIFIFTLITASIFISIFYWRAFPDCFVEGSGLTGFKKNSEYVISLILFSVVVLFYWYRDHFDKNVYRLLIISAILTIIAELAFTFYVSVFGLSNLVGHFFKIISFYLIYLAIIKTGLTKPYDLLFRELKTSEDELLKTNQKLNSDIIERKQAEAELKKNEKKYKTLIENSPYGIFIVDKNKRYIEVNESACTMTGYSKNELLSLSISDIQSLKNPDLSVFPEIINSGKVNRIFFLRHKDGHDFPVTIKGYKVDDNLVGICEDITEKVKNEQLIISSLKEKETLLHEIHHRVKNNMAVIGSLLKMQSNSIEDEQIKEVLKVSKNRVYAMSAVHETLHGSDNLSQIDLKTYLHKVTSSIFQTYSINPDKAKLNTDIEEIPISIDQASPLGLVINELLSNSLKYAFLDERKGEINVSMKKRNTEIELTVMDNGVGMPKDFDWKKSKSLGLKLVRTLVENQLDGSIDMESNNGTKFTIKFNIDET